MGCGCKDKSSNLIKEPIKKTPKYYLNRVGLIILTSTGLLILTPFIVIMVWYLALKMVLGSDGDYVGKIKEKYFKMKDRNEYLEKVDMNNS